MAKKVNSKAMQGIISAPKTPRPAAPEIAPEGRQDRRRSSDPRVPTSVGLRQSEMNELQAIAGEAGTTRNAVAAYFVRYGIKEYRAGRIKFKVKLRQMNTLEMP